MSFNGPAQDFIEGWVDGDLGRKTKEASLSVRNDGPASTLYSYAVPIAASFTTPHRHKYFVVSAKNNLERGSVTTSKHLNWVARAIRTSGPMAEQTGTLVEGRVPTSVEEWEDVLVHFDMRAEGRPGRVHGYGDEPIVKRCGCGRVYTESEWAQLPLYARQVIPADDDYPEEVLELKNCSCSSTLALPLP